MENRKQLIKAGNRKQYENSQILQSVASIGDNTIMEEKNTEFNDTLNNKLIPNMQNHFFKNSSNQNQNSPSEKLFSNSLNDSITLIERENEKKIDNMNSNYDGNNNNNFPIHTSNSQANLSPSCKKLPTIKQKVAEIQ